MTTDIQEQIERRRERARAEILKIVNKGNHPVFSVFEVSSASKKSYRVEIRSLDELQNSCTCPDYKTNLIGTCKHIEGVLISLEKEHGRKLKKLAAERPKGTQIYLHHGADGTVRILLPIPENARVKDLLTRTFDSAGLLVASPLQALPTLLAEIESLPTRDRSLVRVTEAVLEYLALLQDREEVQQQKDWFLDQVKRGRRRTRPRGRCLPRRESFRTRAQTRPALHPPPTRRRRTCLRRETSRPRRVAAQRRLPRRDDPPPARIPRLGADLPARPPHRPRPVLRFTLRPPRPIRTRGQESPPRRVGAKTLPSPRTHRPARGWRRNHAIVRANG